MEEKKDEEKIREKGQDEKVQEAKDIEERRRRCTDRKWFNPVIKTN